MGDSDRWGCGCVLLSEIATTRTIHENKEKTCCNNNTSSSFCILGSSTTTIIIITSHNLFSYCFSSPLPSSSKVCKKRQRLILIFLFNYVTLAIIWRLIKNMILTAAVTLAEWKKAKKRSKKNTIIIIPSSRIDER